ncbi:hypothetical protein ACJMK2_015945 [Sinanodonta woodiana]|uniref:Histone-lysine N-methyltransferase 2E n=1 Tax=Sinanodonta woodiana TaxID=1069815 RepID=A0ABD3UTE8_SINWO
MSVILRYGAVHPDISFRDTAHGLECDAVDSSSPHEESYYTPPPQTYPSCFGLPYQDHNYGAPPPPSPPPPAVSNCNLDVKEEVVVTTGEAQTSPTQITKEVEVDDSITRCICDYLHDDGYMICCDKCSVWQHIECLGIDKNSIPDNYYCEECEPREVDRVRARQIQTKKREMYPHLYVYPTDSSATDTDPEEAQNRLLSHGNNAIEQNKKAKHLKKRRPKDKVEGTKQKKVKKKDPSDRKEKENTSNEANRKQFSVRSRRERVTKVSEPVVIQHEETQDAWDNSKSTWLDRFEIAKVNQYSADMQELLTSKRVNGHHNEIADQVTGGLRVQRCHVAEVKPNRQGLLASEVIEEGLPVVEYIGKVMLRQQYDTDNFFLKQLNPFVLFYSKLDGLDLCIDASSYGNDARYVRRSCQPSAEIRHVVANGQVHFFVVATKEIPVDAEILIPFDYDYKQCSFCVECACERNNCPVSRYHKRVLKLKSKNISTSPIKSEKSPVKSPVRSPLKSTSKSPTKLNIETSSDSSTAAAVTTTTTAVATTTMITRRSQVSRQNFISSKLQQVDVVGVEQEQTNAELSPVEPPQITNSASCKYSTEEENSQAGEDPLTSSVEPRKKSREERKMEAIMRAFEKMEKRQERRKEALTRLEQSRRNSRDEPDECRKENTQISKLEQQLPKVKSGKESKVPKDSRKEDKPVKQEEQSKPSPVISESTEETQVKVAEEITESKEKQEVDVTEIKEEKVEEQEVAAVKEDLRELRPREMKSKGKRAKRTAARRRTRYSIGCINLAVNVSHDEANNQEPLEMASCPVTPADAVNVPPSFKFLKTKRHLMNEWLSEKSQDGKPVPVKTEPLEVTVDESLFVPCLPSPRNFMERLRRNSQSQGCSQKPSTESSAGSAKKRWLRQAMGETPSPEYGLCSPPAFPGHGSMSPNPLTSTHSPGASPPADFVTPLKKRRLARESVDQPLYMISSPSISTVSSQSPFITSTDFNADSKLDLEKDADHMRTDSMEGEAFISQVTEPYVSSGLIEKAMCSAEKEISTSVSDDKFYIKQTTEDTESEIIEPKSISKLPTSSDWDENPVVEGNNVISSDCYSLDNSNLLTTSEILSGVNCVTASTEKLSGRSEVTASSGLSDSFVFVSSRTSADCTVVSSRDTESDMEDSSNPSKEKVNSEPDSSESCIKECVLEKEGPVEMECDSVNVSNNNDNKLDMVSPSFSGENHVQEIMEVDSTQVDDKELRMCNKNNDQEPVSSICISSETRSNSVTQSDVYEIYSDNSHRNKITCSSSSPEQFCSSSEVTDQLKADRDEALQDTSCIDKAQVDSSTDLKQETVLQNCTESSASSDVTYSHISDSVVTSFDDKQEEYPLQITADCQSSVMPKDSSRIEANNDLVSSQCDTDSITGNECSSSSFPTTSSLFIDSVRQTEVTVDSTTSHSLSSNTTGYIHIQDSLQDVSNECESMDVSSASDSGLFVNSYLTGLGKSSPSKTAIEEQQPVSASDQGPSSSNSLQDESQNLPTKKKVSLQEYRKRIKEKPKEPSTTAPPSHAQVNCLPGSTSASGSNSSSSLSGSTSPQLRLDGLPTLPLFVPYTSMRTERKEFKSSSDLVSPIFHRRGKKEEPRKQMSLAERLKHEFGLDDTEEEENSSSDMKLHHRSNSQPSSSSSLSPPPPPPPSKALFSSHKGKTTGEDKTPDQAANSTTPSQSSLQTFQPLGLPHPIPQVPSQQISQLGFHQPQGVNSQLTNLACPTGPQHQLPMTATPQQPPNGLGGSRIPSLMSIPTFPSQQLQAALGQTGQQNGATTSSVVDPAVKLPAAQPQINTFYANLNGHVTGLPQNFPPVISPVTNQQGISAASPHPLSQPSTQAALIPSTPTQVPNSYSSINFASLGSSGTVAGVFSGSGAVCAQQQVFDYSHRSVSSFGSVPNTKQSIPIHHHPHHVSQGDSGSRSQFSGYNNSSHSSQSYSSNQHRQTLSPSSSQRHPCRKKSKHKRHSSGGDEHHYS